MSRVVVLGAGGWGIALAMVACRQGHEVTLWSHDEAELEDLRRHNENRLRLPGVSLPTGLTLTGDTTACAAADAVIMAVPSFAEVPTATDWPQILPLPTLLLYSFLTTLNSNHLVYSSFSKREA